MLNSSGTVTTENAANELGVSESTIRRLFNELEERGDVIRIYGGVTSANKEQIEYYFENLQMVHAEEKRRIGDRASQFVNSGDTLFIDSGTTAQQVALGLSKRLKSKEIGNIQVFTNSMINVEILADYCDVNLLGGLYRSKRKDFCGYITDVVLDVISFDKSFIGADAVFVDFDGGASATDIFTAQINKKVVSRTKENYVIADATKFNKRSLVQYVSMNQINTIITDTYFPDEMIESVEKLGPRLIRV